MGHTNSTANLSLPQFIGTDKPTWLGDINGAFSAIDSYAGTNDAAVAAAVSDASSAISQASAAVNTANTANTTAGNASTAANNAVGVANTANAIAGTVDAKVGLLANLNTTDRTSIVNAINEVYGMAGGDEVSVTADGIATYSQLFDSLFAAADASKVKATSKAVIIDSGSEGVYTLIAKSATSYTFTRFAYTTSALAGRTVILRSSGSEFTSYVNTYADNSAQVPTSGIRIKLIY